MKQPATHPASLVPLLGQTLILLASLCWSMQGAAKSMSDLLIVIDDDGVGYTAQQTVFADDDLVLVRLPPGRQTLNTVFSGPDASVFRRAHEKDPDKVTIASGSVMTRFRHRFNSQPETTEQDTEGTSAMPLRASTEQFETTMASTESLIYRVTWVLPANLDVVDYQATHSSTPDEFDGWHRNERLISFQQHGNIPAQLSIDYQVNSVGRVRENTCLTSIGPSEWCSPDIDGDRVPDYRDICIAVETDQDTATATSTKNTVLADNRTDSTILDFVSGVIPKEALGCPDDTLIVLPEVQFESGQTYLNVKARTVLDKVAVALQRMPDKLFRIASHTDNAGYVSNNQLLSENRADAIRHYLMLRGVGPNQIQARGYGETSPAHDNRTAAGRRANRRVELRQMN